MHDSLGHKGVFSVWMCLLLHFWWPMLVNNVKWYIQTCHKCQIHQTAKLHIPPTVPIMGGLFHKVHINTMIMPRSGGYHYIIQAQCTLMAYPEWHMLWSENTSVIVSFIFKKILCHRGAVSELVTDNGLAFVQALDVLMSWYGIHHIQISPYNSQANGVVEQFHYDVWEAIIKSTLGGEIHWSVTAHSVFWAEYVTILKLTGLLLYFMVHGIKPLFSFWSIQGNVPCPCAWYWQHLYPYPGCLASSLTSKTSGGYRYYYLQMSSSLPVCITQILWAAIQDLDSLAGLSLWWSHLSLQLLDQEGVKLKDEAMLPRPNGGPSQDYWRIILAAIQMVQIELGLARIGSRPVKSRSRLRVLQPS